MSTFEQRVIGLLSAVHPLDRVARAGYVLRGVADPENVAAHSHFVSLMTLLFVDEYPDLFDRHRALSMALIHDLAESKLMDIPMPAGDAHLGEIKERAEEAITDELFDGFPSTYSDLQREWSKGESNEAKLVRALDKAQMMIKILNYEREGRGRLGEFWLNPKNFPDFGLDPLARLFDAICEAAGKTRPR